MGFTLCVFTLQDRTNNLFKQVYEQKSLKGRANDAIASACLYIACRQEGVPRTFKGPTSTRHHTHDDHTLSPGV